MNIHAFITSAARRCCLSRAVLLKLTIKIMTTLVHDNDNTNFMFTEGRAWRKLQREEGVGKGGGLA